MLSHPDLDGCPDEEAAGYSWPETDLGMVAMVSCICGNIDTAEISRVAIRECGGSFAEGAAWVEPDISTCQFSVASMQLCDASTVSLSLIFDSLQHTYQCQFTIHTHAKCPHAYHFSCTCTTPS